MRHIRAKRHSCIYSVHIFFSKKSPFCKLPLHQAPIHTTHCLLTSRRYLPTLHTHAYLHVPTEPTSRVEFGTSHEPPVDGMRNGGLFVCGWLWRNSAFVAYPAARNCCEGWAEAGVSKLKRWQARESESQNQWWRPQKNVSRWSFIDSARYMGLAYYLFFYLLNPSKVRLEKITFSDKVIHCVTLFNIFHLFFTCKEYSILFLPCFNTKYQKNTKWLF